MQYLVYKYLVYTRMQIIIQKIKCNSSTTQYATVVKNLTTKNLSEILGEKQ